MIFQLRKASWPSSQPSENIEFQSLEELVAWIEKGEYGVVVDYDSKLPMPTLMVFDW